MSSTRASNGTSRPLQPPSSRHRQPLILQDPIDQIVASFSSLLDVPQECLVRAKESYRILETRVAIGKLGKGDSREARAAILLHQSLLSASSSSSQQKVSLTWQQLASAIGKNHKKQAKLLEQLSSTISNFLQPHEQRAKNHHHHHGGGVRNKSIATTMTTTTTRGRQDPQEPASKKAKRVLRDTSASSSSTNDHDDRTIFTSLSIRLPCLPQQAAQAHQLYKAILHHVAHNLTNVHERRGYQYDLKRYRPAYQAACLNYLVVGDTTTNKKKAKSMNSNNNDTSSGRGGVDASLSSSSFTLEDFLLPDYTYLELQQVLKQVVQFAQEIKNNNNGNNNHYQHQQQQAKNRNTQPASTKTSNRLVSILGKRHTMEGSILSSSTTTTTEENNNGASSASSLFLPNEVMPSPRDLFWEWHSQLWSTTLQMDPQDCMAVGKAANAILFSKAISIITTTTTTTNNDNTSIVSTAAQEAAAPQRQQQATSTPAITTGSE